MKDTRYPIAPGGIFWSLQGEGHLRGFQMGFVRLAGCSVGCPQCDTDYGVDRRMTPDEIVSECFRAFPATRDAWVWITGGEPTDHELRPLTEALGRAGFRIALATSGVRPHIPPVDWLSVSPHSLEAGRFRQRYGSELKLVDGLHGLALDEWVAVWGGAASFMYRYVQPMSVGRTWTTPGVLHHIASGQPTPPGMVEDPASLDRCLAFLRAHPDWALSRQDHHLWRVS